MSTYLDSLTAASKAAAAVLERAPAERERLIKRRAVIEAERDALHSEAAPTAGTNAELIALTQELGAIAAALSTLDYEEAEARRAFARTDRQLGAPARKAAFEKQAADLLAARKPLQAAIAAKEAEAAGIEQKLGKLRTDAVAKAKVLAKQAMTALEVEADDAEIAATAQSQAEADPMLRAAVATVERQRSRIEDECAGLRAQMAANEVQVAEAQQQAREQAVYALEVEQGELITTLAAAFVGYRIAHREAFGSEPEAPDIALIATGIERDMVRDAEPGAAQPSMLMAVRRYFAERFAL